MTTSKTDAETIAVYDAKAQDYLDTFTSNKPSRQLQAFIDALPTGGTALDIGCGPGNAAAAMRDAGLTVTAIDPSQEMARVGQERFGITIQIGTFDDITQTDHFDGIWASFSMLHVPRPDVPRHLAAIHQALKPGGLFFIGVKTGTGARRDGIGRKYTYFEVDELKTLLADAGFTLATLQTGTEKGLDGTMADFVMMTAHA